MGIDLSPADVAYRCNLVTVEDNTMVDFSAGHISSGEGAELFASLQQEIPGVMLKAGVSYRNLLVVHDGKGAATTPPHDIVGQGISPYLPKGGDADLLRQCMEISRHLFDRHPVNAARTMAGRRIATRIWPWSGGHTPAFPLFFTKYAKKGGIISAVDLLQGIGRCAGMEIIRVPGATGFLDTDYEAKARYAIEAMGRLDFLYLHIEAPDEAGHMGSIEEKVTAIERVDDVVGMILDSFDGIVAVLPDHPTPIRAKIHTRDPVPFAVRGKDTDTTSEFSERAARSGGLGTKNAVDLLGFLFS
jgi:2,3-bisphosphoglycerate-independent phosphoglycerate mutase